MNGRIGKIAAIVGIVTALGTAWGAFGWPIPASTTALAANSEKDSRFRLAYYNQRRDQLYGTRADYQRNRKPVPDWLRRDITRVCSKIAQFKKQLKLPARCDD